MAYVVFFGGLGMLVGAGTRRLLGWLRRGAWIPPPWCELLVGALWAAGGYGRALGWVPARWLPLLLGLSWLAVAAGAVDVRHRRLPDALTVPALPSALVLAVPLGASAVARAALGAALLCGVYLVVRLAAPRSLGAGDVKLAATLGAGLGAASWTALACGVVLASMLTALLGTALAGAGALRRARARAPLPRMSSLGVPHGPSMLVAGLVVVTAAAAGAAGFA